VVDQEDARLVVVPHESVEFGHGTSTKRLSSGNTGLDKMLHGGFYDKSLILVSGPTGTGKSLATTHFVAGGVAGGEKGLLLSFEESRDQIARNANASMQNEQRAPAPAPTHFYESPARR